MVKESNNQIENLTEVGGRTAEGAANNPTKIRKAKGRKAKPAERREMNKALIEARQGLIQELGKANKNVGRFTRAFELPENASGEELSIQSSTISRSCREIIKTIERENIACDLEAYKAVIHKFFPEHYALEGGRRGSKEFLLTINAKWRKELDDLQETRKDLRTTRRNVPRKVGSDFAVGPESSLDEIRASSKSMVECIRNLRRAIRVPNVIEEPKVGNDAPSTMIAQGANAGASTADNFGMEQTPVGPVPALPLPAMSFSYSATSAPLPRKKILLAEYLSSDTQESGREMDVG